MRTAACIFFVLTAMTYAGATIDFFFSHGADPYGLRVPSLAFKHSFNDGYDFSHGYELMPGGGSYAVPPYGEPGVMPNVELVCGSSDWACVWARFNNEPSYLEVGSLKQFLIQVAGAGAGPGRIAWYQCDNRGEPNIWDKRWDGDPDNFYLNPTGMIAIRATGVRNTPGDEPWKLYVGGTHRAFLLGAIKCPATPGELTIRVISMKYAGTPILPDPNEPEPRYLNKVICVVPEPAGLLLLTTLALVSRRQ